MDRLTIALEKVDFLPANRVTDDTSILTLKTLVLEPLVRWDSGPVRPGLFGRWEHSEDGRRWQFFIRDGATFHDGRPCTAGDIIAFIDGILGAVDTFGMKWSYARYLAEARITAAGPGSILVENPEPFADILDIFSEFFISRTTPDGAPVLGTGPYRVTAFEPRRSATLERVRAGNGPARISAVAEPDAAARLALVRTGGADAALNLERVHGRLDFDPALRWGKAANTLSVIYYLNCESGLFASPEARLAANLAIDKTRLIEEVFHGLGIPSATVVSPFHLGMADGALKPIAYDPDRARRLLDRLDRPATVRLRTPLSMPERAPEASAFVAEALAAVGLTMTIDTETDRPDYARQVGRKEIGDLAIFDSSPHSTFRVLNDKISSAVKAVWWQGYDDPETERLIGLANRAVAEADRERAYGRCLKRLNANPPWLYLMHPVEVFAARPEAAAGLAIDHKGVLRIA